MTFVGSFYHQHAIGETLIQGHSSPFESKEDKKNTSKKLLTPRTPIMLTELKLICVVHTHVSLDTLALKYL